MEFLDDEFIGIWSQLTPNAENSKQAAVFNALFGSTSGKMKDYNPDAAIIKDLFGHA